MRANSDHSGVVLVGRRHPQALCPLGSLAVPDLTKKVRLFRDRQLTEHERLAFATGAAALWWKDPNEAPIRPEMLLSPRRYGDKNADLWSTFSVVQENLVRGGQRDHSRRTAASRQMPKSRAVKSIDDEQLAGELETFFPRLPETYGCSPREIREFYASEISALVYTEYFFGFQPELN